MVGGPYKEDTEGRAFTLSFTWYREMAVTLSKTRQIKEVYLFLRYLLRKLQTHWKLE